MATRWTGRDILEGRLPLARNRRGQQDAEYGEENFKNLWNGEQLCGSKCRTLKPLHGAFPCSGSLHATSRVISAGAVSASTISQVRNTMTKCEFSSARANAGSAPKRRL